MLLITFKFKDTMKDAKWIIIKDDRHAMIWFNCFEWNTMAMSNLCLVSA